MAPAEAGGEFVEVGSAVCARKNGAQEQKMTAAKQPAAIAAMKLDFRCRRWNDCITGLPFVEMN